MNKKHSRILSIALAATLISAMAIPALAGKALPQKLVVDTDLSLYMDGQQVIPTNGLGEAVDVFAVNGTTYVPVRFVSETLGAQVGYTDSTTSVYVDSLGVDAKAGEYLEEYFGVTAETSFNDALKAIFGDKAVEAENDTVAAAVTAAVRSCGLEKLALTYTAEKAAASANGIVGIPEADLCYVAAALDSSVASGSWKYASKLDTTTAQQLLMNALNTAGLGRNYLGNASDPDISRKLMSAWNSFTNFNEPTLSQLGANLVVTGASTGYNLKFDGYNANFLADYTIQYGHSDIDHAVQLIALLNSEGIDAKIALEPKTSIYEYMVEWGDPTQVTSSATYALKPIEGTERWLCYATEYDMKLEFDTIEEKNAFDALIQKYAKKWISTGGSTEGLIAGSWYQPLYTSTVPMADTENFTKIQDNVIHNGPYTIHPFSPAGEGDAIASVVAEKAPDLSMDVVDLYVNNAFFRYLTGVSGD